MLISNAIGIDLAKNALQVCHISKHGELISNKAVSYQKLKQKQKQILANQQPAVIANVFLQIG